MRPIDFPGSNSMFAKDQPKYVPLPALRLHDGQVTCCWQLSWRERLTLLFTGKLWHTVLTFNRPLQPQMMSVKRPEIVQINADLLKELGRD
jgi:hypothetical protein